MAISAFAATVTVDLQPCIYASETINRDNTPDAFVISEYYKGFWGATQLTPSLTTGAIGLTKSATEGKCNVVYVAAPVTDGQKLELQAYSRDFKARIVYLNDAETSNDVEVNSRIGISQFFDGPLMTAPFIKLTTDGGSTARVVKSDLSTDPRRFNIFTRPVIQVDSLPGGTSTVMAEYVDANGNNVAGGPENAFPNVAMMAYESDSGYEELHVFYNLAWFDIGSLAWGHYIVEWGTKGIMQGERRFYLAPSSDDYFLGTNVWEFNGGDNIGPEMRASFADMQALASAEDDLNAMYPGSSIKTEHAFNVNGMLQETGSEFVISVVDSDIAQLEKGAPPAGNVPPQHPFHWVEASVDGLTSEFNSGGWNSDDLLDYTVSNTNKFWWQSHGLAHMLRDDLLSEDCFIEDRGTTEIANIIGLWESPYYNPRSMVTGGITGLYNPACLQTAADVLIKCFPGDNSFNPDNGTPVSLVNDDNQFHSIFTTTSTNGFAGSQIIPRYASNIFFNCATADCLVQEQAWIRRNVCGCDNVDPSQDPGECPLCTELLEFGSTEALFEFEAETTTRNLLTGRRDKYMFHQANLIDTNLSGGSLLAHWELKVMEMLMSFIDFPVTSTKFDDLCMEFIQHEDLDDSEALLTATLDNVTGDISGVTLSTNGPVGFIPFTVPTATAGSVSTSGLTIGSTTNYGSDTTYYVASASSEIPDVLSPPSYSDLPPLPAVPMCSSGFPGFDSIDGQSCCPVGCGGCGGSECATMGSTSGLDHTSCCASEILNNEDLCSVSLEAPCVNSVSENPVCSNGISGVDNDVSSVCCPLGCGGKCGGTDCHLLGVENGLDHTSCCAGDIVASGILCAVSGVAPCII